MPPFDPSPSTATLLSGRRVLVTGGARGLGRAFAKAIGGAGGRVVIADLRVDLAEQTARELCESGLDVSAVALDLSDPASVAACAAEAMKRLDGLDGLVNNGAVTNSGGGTADPIEIGTWDRVMAVNMRGTWLMTRECHPALTASGQGAVVNLASDTALWGAPRLLAYVASEGAVIAMSRSLARFVTGQTLAVNGGFVLH